MVVASTKMLDCRERSCVFPGDSTAVDTVIAASDWLGNNSNGARNDVDNSTETPEITPAAMTGAE